MPAFTFEKISSPIRADTKPVASSGQLQQVRIKRSRSLIIDMLDRFAVARIRREQSLTVSAQPSSRDKAD